MENTKHHHTVCSISLGLKFGLKFGTLQRIRQSPVVVTDWLVSGHTTHHTLTHPG